MGGCLQGSKNQLLPGSNRGGPWEKIWKTVSTTTIISSFQGKKSPPKTDQLAKNRQNLKKINFYSLTKNGRKYVKTCSPGKIDYVITVLFVIRKNVSEKIRKFKKIPFSFLVPKAWECVKTCSPGEIFVRKLFLKIFYIYKFTFQEL